MGVFKDVKPGDWYAELLERGHRQGWLNGYPDGTFKPDEYITRAEAAAIADKRAALAWLDFQTALQRVIYARKNAVVVVARKGGLGSGTIIHPDGYILTNFHVIEDPDNKGKPAPEIYVSVVAKEVGGMEQYEKYQAQVIAYEKFAGDDIALIKINAGKPLPYVKIKDKSPKEGTFCVAIGHPIGLRHTATLGIITQDCRFIALWTRLQTDAAINGGNSGGLLMDLEGDMIGIPQSKVEIYGDRPMDNIGFALEPYLIKQFVKKHLA